MKSWPDAPANHVAGREDGFGAAWRLYDRGRGFTFPPPRWQPGRRAALRQALPLAVFDILRTMKPRRRMAAAELLVQNNNDSVAYASATIAGPPSGELVSRAKAKPENVTPAAMARVERELENLQAAVGSVQVTFSRDTLHLVVSEGYLAKLLAKPQIVGFLARHHADLFEQFHAIADVTSTLSTDAAARAGDRVGWAGRRSLAVRARAGARPWWRHLRSGLSPHLRLGRRPRRRLAFWC